MVGGAIRSAEGRRSPAGPRTARGASPTPRLGARSAGLAILAAAVATLAASTARAEPYMAVRAGRRCSSCHANRTGAGLRTLLASTHLQAITRYRDVIPGLEGAGESFNGKVTPFLSLGGDLRLADSIVFEDDPDENGRVPHRAFRGEVSENVLDLRRATTYLLVDLVPEKLSTYVDVSWAPGGVTAREVFALLRILPWHGWIKGGRFFLDYGLRTENDNLFSVDDATQNIFVRGRTGSDFTGFDQGLEVGFEPGPWHVTAAVTDASPGDANVRVTANAYGAFRHLPVVDAAIAGASFSWIGPGDRERYSYGVFAGSNLGPLEYQGEIDFVHERRPEKSAGTFLAYGEANYLLLDWINVKAFGEFADNDGTPDSPDSQQNRFGFGIEPFLGRFLQTRLFYSIANGPRTRAETNQNRIVLEMHVFF